MKGGRRTNIGLVFVAFCCHKYFTFLPLRTTFKTQAVGDFYCSLRTNGTSVIST